MTSLAKASTKILFYGNDSLFAQALSKSLKEIGYNQIKITANHQDFKVELSGSDYQLAILDINEAKEFELVRNLNLKETIPFIILSRLDDDRHIDEAKKLGVSAYLAKTPSLAQLRISIRIAIGNPAFDWVTVGSHNTRFQKGKIFCLAANGHFTNIYLLDGRKIIAPSSITKTVQTIDYPKLKQVHRSYYVNLDKVESYSNTQIFLPFTIDHHNKKSKPKCIPISKARMEAVLQYLENR